MVEQVDIMKVTRYPPEIFMAAKPIDLTQGNNVIADYHPKEYVVALRGISAARNDNLQLIVTADDEGRVIEIPSLGGMRGITAEDEEVKITAFKQLKITIYAPSAVSAYQFRHRVMAFKPNIATKLYYGQPLTEEEETLASKYKLYDILKVQTPNWYNPWNDVKKLKVTTSVLSQSGTILNVRAPEGKKIILLDVTAENPGSANQAYVTVERDYVEDVIDLDLYCLPGLSTGTARPENSLRIVALDYLRVDLNMVAAGTYRVRVVYAESPITIIDKIRWGLELTAEERRIAEEQNLEEKIKVGVI